MAHDKKQIGIAAGQWGADVEPWLEQALATSTMQELKAQWQAGAVLFRVLGNGQTVGAVLLRIDQEPTGPEGVIVAAAAQWDGVDMVLNVIPLIEQVFQGVNTLRFHTANPALVRKMRLCGYAPREVICVKKVSHGK